MFYIFRTPVPRRSNQCHELWTKGSSLLRLERLHRENLVQMRIRTLYFLCVEAEISSLLRHAILHLTTHSFAFTFKEMLVHVTAYFRVECIIPSSLTVK
jgi:hypothetical protein